MAGIYLHIPYCKQACHYCDFHFSTNLNTKSQLVEAICQEIVTQQNYLGTNSLDSIYFGGGTPSILSEQELDQLFETLFKYFSIHSQTEITLEANPDDLQQKKLIQLKNSPVNRLSIGIQTFHDKQLQFLNRAHTQEEGITCIKNAQNLGFDNINVDLIYGIHGLSMQEFEKDVQQLLSLNSQHISAYCLTIEEKTAFGKWLKKGKIKEVNDQLAIQHYKLMIELFSQEGFEQYEISNFTKNSQYSKHNTSYWKGKKYLGLGPGAHSFNGSSRQYNVSNNIQYINKINKKQLPFKKEILTKKDFINEYFMTSLRTKWGCNLDYLDNHLQHKSLIEQKDLIDSFLLKKWLLLKDNHIFLTEEGKLFADYIASEFFI